MSVTRDYGGDGDGDDDDDDDDYIIPANILCIVF
jgi:hypothetical protein